MWTSLFLAALLAAPVRPDDERLYEFSSSQDLEDFEVVAGTWTVSGGALTCTTKGEADEIRWRRRLPGHGVIRAELLSNRATGLALRGDGHEVFIEVQRAEGTFTVDVDGQRRHQGYFEKKRRGLSLTVGFSPSHVEVTPGEDVTVQVTFAEQIPTLVSLSLTSARAQARFGRLAVERPTGSDGEEPHAGGVNPAAENRSMVLEDARRKVEERRYAQALALLVDRLPAPAPPLLEAIPPDAIPLVNEIALLEPRLRREPPLVGWLADLRVESKDGTVSLLLPLGSGWTAEAPLARRVDGKLLHLHREAPKLSVNVHRYDQRIQYWFGEEPRTIYVSGSSTSALARCRADDLLVEKSEAELHTPPQRSPRLLGGEPTTFFEMSYLDGEEGGQATRVTLREYYASHRGNTHRLSLTGSPEALRAFDVALSWIVDTFEFHKP